MAPQWKQAENNTYKWVPGEDAGNLKQAPLEV